MKRLVSLLICLIIGTSSFAQTVVKGLVLDNNNQPLPGVAVLIKGTSIGTITDVDGKYQIQTRNSEDILVFDCVGYEVRDQKVGNKSIVDIVLNESAEFIEEAVVVGYGTMRKKDMTGSVASIKAEAFQNKVLHSVDDALAGGVAGLMVSSASGKPGAASNMLIRGANSLTGSTAPLIVVDGFPLFGVSTSGGGLDSFDVGMSSLAMVNTDDVESIEVLKDASATAIYGNRGANGVILITTKKGKEAGGKIQYNTYVGLQEMNRRYDMMDFDQYAAYQADRNKSNQLFYDNSTKQARNIAGMTTRDWQDEIFRNGFIQNHSLSVQEATKRTNFLFSGSYLQDKSILINTDWQKLTAKVSVDHYFTDKIRMGLDISYSRINDDGVPTGGEGTSHQAGVITSALTAVPYDLRDSDTQAIFRASGVGQNTLNNVLSNYKGSPLDVANYTELQKRINRTIINSYVEADILDDLTFRTTFGSDQYALKDHQYYPKPTPRGWFYKGQGLITSSISSGWINENTLTWKPIFGKHRLNVLAGVSEQGNVNYWDQSEATQFDYEGLGFNNMGMATVFKNYSSKGTTTFVSFMGRVNYTYDNRYIATLTARRDGTSRFIKNKWGNFFSGALAWNVDQEEFMKAQNTVSTLKLRVSAGQVGNSDVPTSGSYAQLGDTFYSFGGNAAIGQYPTSIANEELTWETTTEANLGLELGLFDNRFNLNVDLYNKITKNLLLEAPVINIAGFEKSWQNIGKMRNRGIELSLNATPIQTQDFTWNISANFSRNLTKVLELGQNGAPIYLNATCVGGTAVILQEGGAIGDLYGYNTIGVYGLNHFEENGYTPRPGVAVESGDERPGSMRFEDINNDGKITADDRSIIGNTMPDYYGSFSTDISFKNFNLSAQFNYSVGADIYNANYNTLAAFNSNSYNQMAFFEERWSEENLTSTQYSRMTVGSVCSAFVEDASYLRLKTLRFGYNFSRKAFGPESHIDGLRIYVSADNLFVLTKYSGYDPEVFSSQGSSNASGILTSGFDYGVFPRARMFTLGLNITFR